MIDDAQARLDEAVTAITAARSTVQSAASAEARAAAELDTLRGQRARWITSLKTALAGPLAGASLPVTASLLSYESKLTALTTAAPEAAAAVDEAQARRAGAAVDEVSASLQARHGLDEIADAAAAAVETARTRLRSAQAMVEETETEITAARDALRAARDPLVGLGAPSADDTILAAGWTRLATWAAGQAQMRASELTEARPAAQATASQRDRAQADFAQAETDLSRLRADATAAGKADQEARTRLNELADRIAELDQLLQGAPAEDELTAQLALRDELEAAAADADQWLLKARADRTAAEGELASLEKAESAARARLSAARDPVVRLGAPMLDGVGLLAAWTALATWAASQASALDQDIAVAGERAGRCSHAGEAANRQAGCRPGRRWD